MMQGLISSYQHPYQQEAKHAHVVEPAPMLRIVVRHPCYVQQSRCIISVQIYLFKSVALDSWFLLGLFCIIARPFAARVERPCRFGLRSSHGVGSASKKTEACQQRDWKRGQAISTACTSCQKRKSKCDGGKPMCSLCAQKHTNCEYPDDSRRTVNLRAQNQRLTNQIGQYENLVQLLRRGSSSNAQLIEQALNDSEQLANSSSVSNRAGSSGSSARARVLESSSSTDSTASVDFIPLLRKWQLGVSGGGPGFADVSPPLVTDSEHLSRPDTGVLDIVMNGLEASEDAVEFGPGPNTTSSSSALDTGFATTQAPVGDIESGSDSTGNLLSFPAPGIGTIRVWQNQQGREFHVSPHFVLPLSYMDGVGDGSFSAQYGRVYASFKAQKREELAYEGQDKLDFFSFDSVDGGTLLSGQHSQNTDTLSAFVCRLIQTFLDDRVTMLAFMHMQFRMMKWLIKPCKETFDRLPTLMKPVPEQICIPHPCWVDSMPLKGLRRSFINRPETRSRDWLRMISTCRISGDLTLETAMTLEKETGRWHLNAAFQEYIDNPAVWTFSRSQSNMFPEFESQVNLRDR